MARTPASARPVSLLAALTPGEVRDFLPGPLRTQLGEIAAEHAFVDPVVGGAGAFHAELAARDPEILVAAWKTPPLPRALPPRLRYVCYLCGSVKHLVTRDHVAQGLQVTNWGGSISRVVAEWALFHILACLRRATYWALAMHHGGGWKNVGTETASLFGRRVGIHGFGLVARELVVLLRPFGVRIQAHAPDVTPEIESRFDVQRCDSLEELFAGNDVIVELAPLIPETRGVVTEALLRRIRPGGVFVNLGRGAVVDEEALVRVAREGRVHFGLDVFSIEPLPAGHPLRGLPNVSLTPHLGGPTTDRRRDAGEHGLRNLRAYAAGLPLESVITPEVYDRIS
jgi:phosphoglycerate dehydrogenase-like enzyme